MNRLIKIDRNKYMIKGTDLYVNFDGYNLFIVYTVNEFNDYKEIAVIRSKKEFINYLNENGY